jgi:hypothetical protein
MSAQILRFFFFFIQAKLPLGGNVSKIIAPASNLLMMAYQRYRGA